MRNERPVAAALVVSILGSIIFALSYGFHAATALLGLGIVLAAAGLCVAFAVWGFTLIPQEQVVDQREHFNDDPQGGELQREIESDERKMSRPGLLGLLMAALGALGLASLFPIRSLGPAPGNALFKTKWMRGARVVRENGEPVKRGDLNVDSVVTVFPEGFIGDASSQATLLRLKPGEIVAPQSANWAPEGYAAFSRICTHAGCPVAMYRAAQRQLLCPCHQSLFDVLDGARVLSGPADRALPQLPLVFDTAGYLRAQGDFPEPVGPGFWEHA
ncbi:MAG: ubiquinol-cytochrome c reductase iron-sulfur subunit [Candidatus Baltobacteraceae bacterium]